MSQFNEITTMTELDLLVAFTDLTVFVRLAQQVSSQELWSLMEAHYEQVGEAVEGAGGQVVKFIGDGALIVFPATQANDGILALAELKSTVDQWFVERNYPCRLKVAIHYGLVLCGPMGTCTDKRFDVNGATVMTAATMKGHTFAMTAQAFRQLAPDARQQFKKHTPPITYIPVESKH